MGGIFQKFGSEDRAEGEEIHVRAVWEQAIKMRFLLLPPCVDEVRAVDEGELEMII